MNTWIKSGSHETMYGIPHFYAKYMRLKLCPPSFTAVQILHLRHRDGESESSTSQRSEFQRPLHLKDDFIEEVRCPKEVYMFLKSLKRDMLKLPVKMDKRRNNAKI